MKLREDSNKVIVFFINISFRDKNAYNFEFFTPFSIVNSLSVFLDLTTYDTAKQLILRHTGLKDNALTHAMSR